MHITNAIINIHFFSLLHSRMGDGYSELIILYIHFLRRNVHYKLVFFISFVTFTINHVDSVIWNQSINKNYSYLVPHRGDYTMKFDEKHKIIF